MPHGGVHTPSLERHAETILRAAKRRPTVTDSLDVLRTQIREYTSMTNESSRNEMSRNLVDSAYIARRLDTPRCRALNAALGN